MHPALDVHRAALERWRHAMDLVGPGPIEPHFADAQAAITGLEVAGRWADLGSGAGFPGIALACAWPAASVLLVERREKRAAFLREVVATGAIANAEVLQADATSLEPGFDGVISRAYKPPMEYLGEARNLLRTGGIAVLLATDDGPDLPGLRRFHVERYAIEGKNRTSVRYVRE